MSVLLFSYTRGLVPTRESYEPSHTPQPRGIHRPGLSPLGARCSVLAPGQLPAVVIGWGHCFEGRLAPPLALKEPLGPLLGYWVLAELVHARIGYSNITLLGRYWWSVTL